MNCANEVNLINAFVNVECPIIFATPKKWRLSSAGLEHLPYKQRAIGSNPIASTFALHSFSLRSNLCGLRWTLSIQIFLRDTMRKATQGSPSEARRAKEGSPFHTNLRLALQDSAGFGGHSPIKYSWQVLCEKRGSDSPSPFEALAQRTAQKGFIKTQCCKRPFTSFGESFLILEFTFIPDVSTLALAKEDDYSVYPDC